MKNIIKFLENNGANLSSDIADAVARETGKKTTTIRRMLSRECAKPNSLIARLALKFPHNESFIYLKSANFNNDFFTNLKKAANKTNSNYAYIFNAFEFTNGVMKYNKAYILSGSPSRIKGHIGYDTIIETLKRINLCTEVDLNGKLYLYSLNANNNMALAQEKIEEYLIKMIKDWIVKNSFSSSGVIDKNNEYANFRWDITAPSYLHFIRQKEVPGFVIVDVIYNMLDENSVKYFIHKINIVKNLKNVPKSIPILVAKYFTPEALTLAKQQGIIATTPYNLFGQATADLFEELLKVLINAGNIAATDFPRFLDLFNKLDAIKGSSLNLAGDLFEFIVGHCYKTIYGGSLDIGRIIKYDAKEKEIDVILRTERNEQYYIECKGYGSSHLIEKADIENWIQKIKFIKQWYKQHNPDKQVHLKFGYITTSDFKDDAKRLLEEKREEFEKSKKGKWFQIFYMNGKDFVNFIKSNEIRDRTKIVNVLKEHYFNIEI